MRAHGEGRIINVSSVGSRVYEPLGAYADYARRYAAALSSEPSHISSPAVVARAIARAATTRRPRARYAVSRGAKAALLARWLLPDRVFDPLMVALFTTLASVTARRDRKSKHGST
jgi:hypothetical protein